MSMQNWQVSADGGFLANVQLSSKLREATQPLMKSRQFLRPEPGFGKGQGDSLDFIKVSNVATQGGKITEAVRIPVTKFAIRKATLTIDEWGNSVEYTGKLEALSEFNISNPVQKAIRNDQAKALDKMAMDGFKGTEVGYTPTSETAGTLDTDGTFQTVVGANFNLFHLKEIVDRATEDQVPPMFGGEDGDYVMIATQRMIRGLYDDPDWQEVAKYANPQQVLKGEIGRIYRTRFVLTTYTSALTKVTQTADPTIILGQGMFLGDDACVEGVAIPEEVRAKIPDDYGRSKGIAWYALLGTKHTWSFSADAEYRAIFVTGAAA